jgi:hypothetical protein
MTSSQQAYERACLSLADFEHLGNEQREEISSRIATDKRHLVLGRLSGVHVAPGALTSLGRCAADSFTRPDWVALLRILDDVEHRRALGHLRAITPCLVAQFDAIPPALRLPSILALTNHLALPAARWKSLGDILEAVCTSSRASLMQTARRIRGCADFWDFFFRCLDVVSDGMPFPAGAPDLGPRLVRLDTPALMRREAQAMRNCLEQCIDRAARGDAAYYRWTGADPATVELIKSSEAWQIRSIRGFRNALVPEQTADAIRAVLSSLLATCTDTENQPTYARSEGGIASTEAIGRAHFAPDERARVADALWRIHDGSAAPNEHAFCILEAGGGYIQFLARLDGLVYLAEISSHHFIPSLAAHLTEEVVSFLETTGFAWPRSPKSNFAREFMIHESLDCAHLADLALGVLRVFFGHESGGTLGIKVHLP